MDIGGSGVEEEGELSSIGDRGGGGAAMMSAIIGADGNANISMLPKAWGCAIVFDHCRDGDGGWWVEVE